MAWCPKCKNEYIEGILVCPDCEVDLVEELPKDSDEEMPVPVILCRATTEEVAAKFVMYLQYNGLQTAGMIPAEDLDCQYEDGFCVVVADFEENSAKEILKGFDKVEELSQSDLTEMMPEFEKELEDLQEEEANIMLSELRNESSTVYVKKKDKYTDLKFSGISFIVFALIGLGILFANYMGYFNIFNTFSSFIMLAVFIIFFFIGIASLSKANKMVAMVSQEEEVNDDILTWIEENITDEWIATLMNEEETEENNYFLVHKTMCDKVEQQYPLINKDYIDQLMDERYNDYCEENK